MNPPANNAILTSWTNRVLIALFIVILWLPTVDIFFHFDHARQPNEKRLLATFPKLAPGVDGLRKYLAGLDAYFSDHFGCRKLLVSWHNKLKWKLFHDVTVRNVLIGRDGWFFLADKQMVEHQRGVRQFTPEELRDWQTLLERRRDWLAQRGIKFLFVVAPDKASIYPDELPAWMTKVRPETKLDQFTAHMRTHSTVEILDLRESLCAARQIAPTYLKTDTHWNLFGSFVGYQELVKALSRQLPGIQPVPLDSFERQTSLGSGGDLVNMLGIRAGDSNYVSFTPKTNLPPLKLHLPPEKLPKDPMFSDNPQAAGDAIIFHDSFANSWVPFLAYNFRHVDYVWQYELDVKTIEREKPTVIIVEMFELFFNVTDPKELMRKDALP
jgi:alginate O-acetyltransferase complex protein AlgJ